MVNYAEEADFVGRGRRKKRISPQEAIEKRRLRDEKRTEPEWRAIARDIVYRQLAISDRSEKQLRDALERREVPDAIIEETISKFYEAELIDDGKFAKTFVKMRFADKTTSRRQLREDLRKKGVDGVIAEEALAQISEEDEYQKAANFVAKKARGSANLDKEVLRRRIYGGLMRRGFSSPVISRALGILEEESKESNFFY
ncbi:regulatory protein RecX [Arcanobacterium ihumii]|uniref:regulatory protein RecX n=1 Tax=Arcanobacterium ihumii TaxID=2138162 RepID=UPI000F532E61|nr:regulatory protein RecX [Arcanobacterium ihumii]